jgi:hypothetical protein
MGKYALAYKVPIQQISQLSVGGEDIHICGCARYGFVRVGGLSNIKEYALVVNSAITKFSPVYAKYPLEVFNFSSRVRRDGECRGCGTRTRNTCSRRPWRPGPRASRKRRSVAAKKGWCKRATRRTEYSHTPPRALRRHRKLTVEERLNMSLDDIIAHNSQRNKAFHVR